MIDFFIFDGLSKSSEIFSLTLSTQWFGLSVFKENESIVNEKHKSSELSSVIVAIAIKILKFNHQFTIYPNIFYVLFLPFRI